MGKKVYSSGISASDRADDRPRKSARTKLADPGAMRSVGAVTEATRAKATENVRWLAPDDAEEILEALGLAVKPSTPSPRCPTCGSQPGTQCKSDRDLPLRRWHIARTRLAETEGAHDD